MIDKIVLVNICISPRALMTEVTSALGEAHRIK